MTMLVLVASVVCSGLALGNAEMVQRMVKGQSLAKVDKTITDRIAVAVGQALPLVSGRVLAASLAQRVDQGEDANFDFSKLPPAQRLLPDYMQDEQGLTYDVLEYPLHVSAAIGDYGKTAELLANDAVNVNALDRRGRTPLHVAIEADDLYMVALLIQSGADIDIAIDERQWFYKIVDSNEENAREGEPIVRVDGEVKKLKKKQIVFDDDGLLTPVKLAIRNRSLVILALLLLEEANIKPIAHSHSSIALKRSPTRIAAMRGDLASLVLLDRAGADLAEVEFNSFTNPFRLAVANEKWDVVEYLLDRMPAEIVADALKSAKSAPMFSKLRQKIAHVPLDSISGGLKGQSLLDSHAVGGNVEVVEVLIDEYGMDPNAKNNSEPSVLHHSLYSCRTRIEETITALLQRGADPLVPYRDWGTPFDIAREQGLGHLFLPYLDKKQQVPDDITQFLARREALASYPQ